MKKVFVVTMLLVFAVLSVFAMPKDEAMTQINLIKAVKEDGKMPIFDAVKDSYAVASGMKGILFIDGDFRGFAPTALNSMVTSKEGDTIQVISALANHGDNGTSPYPGMLGIYYTVSFDGGATFSVPILISVLGGSSYIRMYNQIAVAEGQYPYVIMNYRTTGASAYIGDWFTNDPLGPGAGGWTSPLLVTDTASYAAYMPTAAVNSLGDKVAMIAYDAVGGIGSNFSTDYGATWGTYGLPTPLNDSIWGPDVCAARWGAGDDVHAIIGMSWYDEVRYDIAGASAAFFEGYSKSTDAGANWSVPIGIFNGERRTNIPSISGDTFTYYLDTIMGNGTADSAVVKCYLDEATGYWADELGVIDGGAFGFGTWWYWWDAEYITEINTFFYAIPMVDMWHDYYIEPSGDLYTFSWQGQSILFGFKADADAEFTYDYIDLHDAAVLDSTGNTATWRGNLFSANVSYDKNDGTVYIIYQDYVDPAVGEPSIEALKINGNEIYRTTLLLNAAPYTTECAAYVSDAGLLHVTICPGSVDSIYYKAVDLYDAGLTWEYIGVSNYTSGINTGRVVANADNNLFSMPSIVKNDSKISFTLKSNTEVSISLYDVTGRMVKTLAKGSFTKGTHTVNMNSNDFNQGVYFVKVNAEDMSDSKKVIVVK